MLLKCASQVCINIFCMYRERLLTHTDDADPLLLVFLKLIDLLASCYYEDLCIMSICKNIIGISELLKVCTYSDNMYLYGKIFLLLDPVYG